MIDFRKNMQQKNKIRKDFSAIVLAAGNSLRMGFPKPFLKYNAKQTFIEHIIDEYGKFGCKEIVVVANAQNYQIPRTVYSDKVKVIINKHPEWHRFYSLKIGALALDLKTMVFVQNVDNPFVNPQVLTALLQKIKEDDYIYPGFQSRGGHPFLLSEKILENIIARKENQVHLKEFLNQFPRKKVETNDARILVNINTLNDYERYINWAEDKDE
ncbi:MAG: NTP transferase domain-containing protein [Bacteroidales bacterium]|jgi:CTP:molybdopterin cytidylyltransferase MocA|nr:NTP transferase domain-containing protein [Bacteroidales bacterium]